MESLTIPLVFGLFILLILIGAVVILYLRVCELTDKFDELAGEFESFKIHSLDNVSGEVKELSYRLDELTVRVEILTSHVSTIEESSKRFNEAAAKAEHVLKTSPRLARRTVRDI